MAAKTEKKAQTANSKILVLQDVTKYLRMSCFVGDFTPLNIKAGLNHRLNGYTSNKKPACLNDNDKKELAAGLLRFAKELIEVANATERSLQDA